MNLRQIREEAWDIARELNTPDGDRLWPATQMNRYINRVYRKIARDCKCIRDSTTPAVTVIDCPIIPYTDYDSEPTSKDYYWANTVGSWLYHLDVCAYLFDLHPTILDIQEVKWRTRDWRLYKVASEKWQKNTRWETTVGLPIEFATDLESDKIALNYRSDIAGTLDLVVKRMPLVDLINDDDVPEFRIQYHDFFVNGILEQMYSKQDAQAFDGEKSASYKAKFRADITEIKEEETKINERLRPNHSMSAFR